MISSKRLLLPMQGEEVDAEILKLACGMARQPEGKIYALYIVEVPRLYPLDADLAVEAARGEEVLNEAEAFIKHHKCNVVAELLQARNAGTAIVKEAVERDVDLILMGLPYKHQHGSFSMGRVTPYVLENSPCPVLVLRGGIASPKNLLGLRQGVTGITL